MTTLMNLYRELHDGLSDMIEGGRLDESAIPDDYQWLVSKLEELGNHPDNPPEGEFDPEDETITGDLEAGTENDEANNIIR